MQANEHDDVVHDVAFDFYGRRFVSVSSDKTVKVRQSSKSSLLPTLNLWTNSQVWDRDERGQWTVADGGEFKAHEESVLRASWAHPEFGQVFATCSTDHTVRIWEEQEGAITDGQKQRWQSKAQLNDSKRPILDVQFAPRHHGLKLATASSDGSVRIYEANDVFSLNYWPMQEHFDAHPEGDGVTALSWNTSAFEPPMIVTAGSRQCRVWKFDESTRKWSSMLELPCPALAHDVKWAPNMGRSFHLIAVACRDNDVVVHVIRRQEGGSNLVHEQTYRLSHDQKVWRCAWNVTGTVLSTSDDDGAVTLWKRNFDGEWSAVATHPSQHEEAHANYHMSP